MDLNIYQQVQALQKSPVETGGLCSIAYFKIEDVLVWPPVDPVSGFIATAIQMKPGALIYICQAVDKGRSFEEEEKNETSGSFIETKITATLAGHNTANLLSLNAARFHKWGLLVQDRAGFTRLIGNKDSGASLSWKYDAADREGSRKVLLSWIWSPANASPIYLSQAFTITIGGINITAGALVLILRFRVGDAGAPMANGSTVLINNSLANKNILVLADGTALPIDDGSGQINWAGVITRHVQKTVASNQITFMGGVVQNEIIEIYAFS